MVDCGGYAGAEDDYYKAQQRKTAEQQKEGAVLFVIPRSKTVFQAMQWNKCGDAIGVFEHQDTDKVCAHCTFSMKVHGQVQNKTTWITVCPTDYILYSFNSVWVVSEEQFEENYLKVVNPWSK